MAHALQRHPDYPCKALERLEVEMERPQPRQLLLRYRLVGIGDGLVWPPAGEGRADGLWRRTCFEAFVRPASSEGYRELNFAGGRWAAYRFDGYRQGMADAEIGPPEAHQGEPCGAVLELRVRWELDLPGEVAWRVGVSAVIEEAGGRLSYWALRHPAGKPDFHHPDCFALELPAPDRT